MAYTFTRTEQFDADISRAILAEFPGRTGITLGEIAQVCDSKREWILVVHGMVFTESGTGRDVTAKFRNNGGNWVIYDYYYDY